MSRSTKPTAESTRRQPRRRQYARWGVRVVLLVAAVVLLSPSLEDTELSGLVSGASPLVATASLLATWAIQAATWIGLSIAGVALFRRRFFCRWVCPTGTCTECASTVGRRLNRRSPSLPAIGQWIAMLTLGGAVLGYPVLLWLDPLALFSGSFGPLDGKTSPGVLWNAAGLLVLLALTVVWPNAWCARVCPLGALQEVLHGASHGVRSALARPRRSSSGEPATGLSRRVVMGASVGAVWAATIRRVRASTSRPLRPPGAVDESRFVGLCIRCGNCLRVCPVDIIHSDQLAHGVAAILAPKLDFSHDYCREDCVSCTVVCPSGALSELAPTEKKKTRIGLPRVNMELCLLGDDRECSLCRNWCPYEAITRVFSEVEYTLTPKIDPVLCTGCGACELACPTTPTKAIIVVPDDSPAAREKP